MNIKPSEAARVHLKQYQKWYTGGAILAVVLMLFVWLVPYRMSVMNEGESKQETIEAVYKNAQIALSTCLDQGKVAAQVADAEFERLKDVLMGALSARYVDANGNPTDASEALVGGGLFSAIVEQYPTIDQSSFQNLQFVVVGCRDNFQGAQDLVVSQIARFEEWKLNNGVFNTPFKNNFPSKTLDVVNLATGEVLYGEEALRLMDKVILLPAAIDSYAKGEMPEQDLFDD